MDGGCEGLEHLSLQPHLHTSLLPVPSVARWCRENFSRLLQENSVGDGRPCGPWLQEEAGAKG